MFEQAPINRLSNTDWSDMNADPSQANSDRNGVRLLLADLTELVELQCRLFADDVRSTLTALARPAGLFAVVLLMGLATLPVLILAIANMLTVLTGWPTYASQFASVGIALVVAAGLFLTAVKLIQNSTLPLKRSAEELQKNLATFREMLLGDQQRSENRPPYKDHN